MADETMPEGLEIVRLASAVNQLRPDWPVESLQTFIVKRHRNRPLRDLAVALVYVACDPKTESPARIETPGPWWPAAAARDRIPEAPRICAECGSFHEPGEPHRFARPVAPEVATRGAAAARAAIAAARGDDGGDDAIGRSVT